MLLGPGDDLQTRLHLREELEPLLLAVERLPFPEAPACLDHPGIEQDVADRYPLPRCLRGVRDLLHDEGAHEQDERQSLLVAVVLLAEGNRPLAVLEVVEESLDGPAPLVECPYVLGRAFGPEARLQHGCAHVGQHRIEPLLACIRTCPSPCA
jgi:hypothetical protein